jgi:hypothetical protein
MVRHADRKKTCLHSAVLKSSNGGEATLMAPLEKAKLQAEIDRVLAQTA